MARLPRLAVAFAVCVAAAGALSASADARSTPPPVPACFKEVGICDSVPLKSAISPVKLTDAQHGVFELTGPAPLQTTSPVACGDAGCIFNHLDWIIGPGGTVEKGCQPNTTSCDVKIAPRADAWVPVVVNQNDYPQALFLLWTAGGCSAAAAADTGDRIASGPTALVAGCHPLATGIDWTMPPRLTGPATGVDGLPDTADIFPASWRADVFVTRSGQRTSCTSGQRWTWTVSPPSGAKLLSRQPPPGCSFTLEGSRLGGYRVTARAERLKRGKWVSAGRTLHQTVELKDYVIVGLGDSNGSGEGNPPFYFDTCNRSVASYQYRSALYVEDQDPRSSVTFLHASCSGARIDNLLSTPYAGIRPGLRVLRPQIKQVSVDIGVRQPERAVDAVILSAGVNDLAFGSVMKFCLSRALRSPLTPCEELPVIPTFDDHNRVKGWSDASSPTTPTLRDRLTALQHEVLGRYGPLASRLALPVSSGGLGVAPSHVLITQYPNFSNGANGQPCGTVGAARLEPSTWTWLGQAGDVLNRTIATASTEHHWTLVPASAAFGDRGYCAPNSLFVGIGSAVVSSNSDGSFHPNAEGHLIQAEQVEPRLCRVLGLDESCKSNP